MDMWRTLRDYLKVEIETDTHEVNDKDAPVTVKFTVTNSTGPPKIDTPEIVFEDVVLTVRTSAGSQEIALGSFDPEQSATHDMEMPFTALMDMEYDVNGTVSPTAFMGVRRTGRVSNDAVSITIPAYLQMFEDMAVHQWLESTVREFPVPGADTTLGELSRLGEPLGQAIMEIRDTEARIQKIAGLVERRQRERIARLQTIVGEYLRETSQGISQIAQELRSTDQRKLRGTIASVTTRLAREAERVEEEVDALAIAVGVRQAPTPDSPEPPSPPPNVPRPPGEARPPEKPKSGGGYGDAGGDDWDNDDDGRTPNDDRSDSMNPNNDAYQNSMDNRSDQMNPNSSNYR